jgi:hypothetical protein
MELASSPSVWTTDSPGPLPSLHLSPPLLFSMPPLPPSAGDRLVVNTKSQILFLPSFSAAMASSSRSTADLLAKRRMMDCFASASAFSAAAAAAACRSGTLRLGVRALVVGISVIGRAPGLFLSAAGSPEVGQIHWTAAADPHHDQCVCLVIILISS